MAVLTVIDAVTRPHFETGCWCNPETCECCGGVAHHIPDIAPDVQPRMAVFGQLGVQIHV